MNPSATCKETMVIINQPKTNNYPKKVNKISSDGCYTDCYYTRCHAMYTVFPGEGSNKISVARCCNLWPAICWIAPGIVGCGGGTLGLGANCNIAWSMMGGVGIGTSMGVLCCTVAQCTENFINRNK